MAPAIKVEERYTYKDYMSWPDNERWELINAIAYNMSPAAVLQGLNIDLQALFKNIPKPI